MSVALPPVQARPLPRGPRGAWLTGNLADFTGDPLGFLERCVREHGDFVPVRFLNKRVVVVNDHAAIEEIMLTQSRKFSKMTGYQTPLVGRVFGQGLLTSDGSFWVRQRKLAQPAFHRQRVAAYAPFVVDLADEMLLAWQDGETKSIHSELSHLTARVIIKALFGAGMDVPPEIKEFDQLSYEAMLQTSRQKNIVGLLLSMLPSDFSRRFHAMMDRLDAFLYRMIAERRATGGDGGDILSMLVAARDEEGAGMTDKQLRDELMTLITAGLDTTVLAMTWSCYLLARHPEAAARVHEELGAVLGGRRPELADLPSLKYTEAVLRESMRLYPPAWVVTREATTDCVIGGYALPKGTAVMASQWLKHRDERVFERAADFDPSRWLKGAALPKFAYFPFGGGPRLCIGSGLAMIEGTLGLARICQRFRFECAASYAVKPWATITLHPTGGMHLRVRSVAA